ncbi:putative leucine-rich repeat domain, L domain-containing protein [Medicago truncatula]|uniref:Putative leucine-rich repeat domain, L domain-containing protein n=2 Tax=Medicago truncatula TaxID=3880 RepID=A0A396HV46_MEDTR|nr:putative leucine-rich repeat domain, L domain-containing protein [Medicago truncatula]
MRELNLDNCKYLTHIFDVSCLPNLEKISFRHCENLMTIDSSVGFLNKLKIIRADGCLKLMSFPPMELTSLQRLELSFCDSLECFPEILGEMENITEIVLEGTSIEELSYSFQNLTGLRKLQIRRSGVLRLPSNILMMPKLSYILVEGILLLPNKNDNLSSSTSSNVEILRLPNCNLSDEFLQTSLAWFANVIHLDLSRNSFTILPEFIKECHFLITLNLNDCTCLREIRGIPPNLKRLSALQCESLSSSCRSMLLNQELHEAGSTDFCLPGTSPIPEWFQHQTRGSSISFWFRNNVPSVSLFVALKPMRNECINYGFLPLATINLTINGHKFDLRCPPDGIRLMMSLGHTYLSDMQLHEMDLESKLEEELLRNEWVHVEVLFKHQMKKTLLIESGIHLFKQKSSMEDIQFNNP